MEGTEEHLHHIPDQYDFLSHSNKEHSLERVGTQGLMLRALPCSMKEKRLLRQLTSFTGKDVSSLVALKQSLCRSQKKLREGAWNLVKLWRLWKVPLDNIGGNFGPGIQSYFSFLRFLLFINFLAVLLTATFILLPVTIYHNVTIFLKDLGAESECLNYTIDTNYRPAWQRLQDIFTGEGSLEHSYLFYGAYQAKQDCNHHYNVPLAYLLSILGYLFACLIWIFQRIVASVVQGQMQRWEFKPCCSARIFTEWDFCIQNPETATLKQKNIYNDLKIDLAEQIRLLQNQQRTRKQIAQQYLLRVLINSVILLLMAAAFYGIHVATEFSQGYNQEDAANLGVFSQYLPPVVISIANSFLPLLFHVLARLEGYAPNTEVNLTLVSCDATQHVEEEFKAARSVPWCVILKLSSLGMFLFFLGHRVLCIGNRTAPQCQLCGYNKFYQCWETHIGQEMYKMTLFSFLTTLASGFLISLPRRLLAKHFSCALAQWLGKEEFLVPHNVLDIVAAQTAIWIGIFFCPLLPLLGCIIIFFTFYIKKYILFQTCQSSVQLFRASRSKFLFQVMLLLGLFLAYISLGYVISSASPSQGCGLFSKYSVPWEVVRDAVSHFPILNYATSSGFCFSLLMVLSLILTVYISQTQANKKVIASLKKQHAQCIQEKWNLVRKLDRLLIE